MANNYMQFAFMWTLPSAADADTVMAMHKAILKEYAEDATELGFPNELGFSIARSSPTEIGVFSDEDGSMEDVVSFIEKAALSIPMTGTLQIEWAMFCSKMRVGEFGGGAVLVDLTGKRESKWVITSEPLSFDA